MLSVCQSYEPLLTLRPHMAPVAVAKQSDRFFVVAAAVLRRDFICRGQELLALRDLLRGDAHAAQGLPLPLLLLRRLFRRGDRAAGSEQLRGDLLGQVGGGALTTR